MLRPSKFRLSTLQHIPLHHRPGTHPLVFCRHRSSQSKQSKPNLQTLQRILNNSEHPRPKSGLESLVPFPRQGKLRTPTNEPHRRRPHVPHEQPHEQTFRGQPPRARHVPHWFKETTHGPAFPEIGDTPPITYFENHVQKWANDLTVANRMRSFGMDSEDCQKLLRTFVNDVKEHRLSDDDNSAYYGLERFSHEHHNKTVGIDVIYSTVFFSWAADPANAELLEKKRGVSPSTLDFIRRMVKASSRSFPADDFPLARASRRKVILHVGPTNSGKTHHALRALAAAPTGVYAGPLRLLAHEIWHRLNTGRIIPLGIEATPEDFSRAEGNPKYATPCNMVTGEERKYVEGAQLVSCTVEMLPYHRVFDVAVVDEIQLIADPDRGGGWVNAVYGLRAHELHLCGEETAVPIVQKLLQHTGDEIIVKRYERLTPLVVEKKSLGGNLKTVKKGDCIVTFSRSNIFNVKKIVEKETGLKCAVVYGRLPPEIRNEQAALFNDPDSDYDVIVGSDAIGMGLNLKIKRVIFEAMHKYQASMRGGVPLSISSIKQIAGRAGRYGLHKGKVDLGGTTTTLHAEDLPLLASAIAQPYKPLSYACTDITHENISNVLAILPSGTSMEVATQACRYAGRLPPYLRYTDLQGRELGYRFIDREWNDMCVSEKLMILNAPIPWRDWETSDIIRRLLHIHANESSVKMEDIMRCQGHMKVVEDLEKVMIKQVAEEPESSSPPESEQVQETEPTSKTEKKARKKEVKKEDKFVNPNGLMALECLHKILVFYIWMGFRNHVVYTDVEQVVELKERIERVLNWTLSRMGMSKEKEVEHPMQGKEKGE